MVTQGTGGPRDRDRVGARFCPLLLSSNGAAPAPSSAAVSAASAAGDQQ